MRESRRIFEGVKVKLDLVKITTPDGRQVEREVVVHGGAVAILGILDDGRIVMIHNHRHTLDQTLWELPAGTLEAGEDPAVCAGREMIEETGYEAAKIEPLCEFYTSPGILTERMYCFVATGLKHVGQALEETEQITVEPVAPAIVLEMIKRGEIVDGKSVAALLYWWTFVRDH
ncbi:MAG: NUDIX domain-containing protein [Planctomycetes bacterium]|nr:NUDIX domain-containing protein [Planctomycetota bacterium]